MNSLGVMIKSNWTVDFTFDFHFKWLNDLQPPQGILAPPQNPLIGAYFTVCCGRMEGGGTFLKVFKMAEK